MSFKNKYQVRKRESGYVTYGYFSLKDIMAVWSSFPQRDTLCFYGPMFWIFFAVLGLDRFGGIFCFRPRPSFSVILNSGVILRPSSQFY
jgi:hypothetical protein